MREPRDFNGVKAAFYLVAFVIGFQCLVVLIGLAACLYWSASMIEGKMTCAARDVISELLAQAMAAALAFSGGFLQRDKERKDDDSSK